MLAAWFLIGLGYVVINGVVRKLYDEETDPMVPYAHLLFGPFFVVFKLAYEVVKWSKKIIKKYKK
jgi:hypothetical protein